MFHSLILVCALATAPDLEVGNLTVDGTLQVLGNPINIWGKLDLRYSLYTRYMVQFGRGNAAYLDFFGVPADGMHIATYLDDWDSMNHIIVTSHDHVALNHGWSTLSLDPSLRWYSSAAPNLGEFVEFTVSSTDHQAHVIAGPGLSTIKFDGPITLPTVVDCTTAPDGTLFWDGMVAYCIGGTTKHLVPLCE